ncbi:hypothetical protein CEXT_363371 [Caerostris extrusa]|uniref:Uncharacterized protein n=1 Tax=Caerostris extrusa TaxID=172846 RepID=A0AAV4STN8_CAEEX|nr:hypothetical protein CEXT_363371 [Caerostris extrusa]
MKSKKKTRTFLSEARFCARFSVESQQEVKQNRFAVIQSFVWHSVRGQPRAEDDVFQTGRLVTFSFFFPSCETRGIFSCALSSRLADSRSQRVAGVPHDVIDGLLPRGHVAAVAVSFQKTLALQTEATMLAGSSSRISSEDPQDFVFV